MSNIFYTQKMSEKNIYVIELYCDYEEWWRYNIFMTAVCKSTDGSMVDYVSFSDTCLPVESGEERNYQPSNYSRTKPLVLTSAPCGYIELYIYIVTNTFPSNYLIRSNPPFGAEVKVRVGDRVVDTVELEVNQWGGATIVGRRVGV